MRLMTMAGARTCIGIVPSLPPDVQALVEKHWSPPPSQAFRVRPQIWAEKEPFDPAKVEAFTKQILELIHKFRDPMPPSRPDHIAFFTEPSISRLARQRSRLLGRKALRLTTRAVADQDISTRPRSPPGPAQGISGHQNPFPLGRSRVRVAAVRAGFPKELVDGPGSTCRASSGFRSGNCTSSRSTVCYFKQGVRKSGHSARPTCVHRGHLRADRAGRGDLARADGHLPPLGLISMAYGVTTFYSGWFAFDCGNYYGAEHYGGCGIQRQIPYCDPKPAYAAYATMTDKLNEANSTAGSIPVR